MNVENIDEERLEMNTLCITIKELVKQQKYSQGLSLISEYMGKYPHSPEPHNYMGLILERENQHALAMKHFRAAWSLDPTYLPARYNMEQYSDFCGIPQKEYYTTKDCTNEKTTEQYKTEYDDNGIAHSIKRTQKFGISY